MSTNAGGAWRSATCSGDGDKVLTAEMMKHQWQPLGFRQLGNRLAQSIQIGSWLMSDRSTIGCLLLSHHPTALAAQPHGGGIGGNA